MNENKIIFINELMEYVDTKKIKSVSDIKYVLSYKDFYFSINKGNGSTGHRYESIQDAMNDKLILEALIELNEEFK